VGDEVRLLFVAQSQDARACFVEAAHSSTTAPIGCAVH
jgi:hypothetical protein